MNNTDILGTELHVQGGMGRMIASGSLGSVLVSMLALEWPVSSIGSKSALGAILFIVMLNAVPTDKSAPDHYTEYSMTLLTSSK